MKNVFISFSSKQTEEAERICDMLEKTGISCYISTRDLVPGEEYASQLISQIDDANVVVLLLSKDSNESPHVLREIEYAVSHHTPILVYALEEVNLSKSMEYFLMTHQWITGKGELDQKLVKSIFHIIDKNREVPEVISEPKPSAKPANSVNKLTVGLGIALAVGLIFILILSIILIIGLKNKNTPPSPISTKQEVKTEPNEYRLGDTITFGNYYNEPIEWRVLKINDDNTLILVSKDILTIKAFDAAEGGHYNTYDNTDYWLYENHEISDPDLQILVRGNNNWGQSNIRTWLNSTKEIVNYPDQAPTRNAVGNNFYDSEPGFLNAFSEEEIDALVTINHSGSEDKVFLLSSDELEWFKEADIQIYAKPTESCKKHDESLADYESYSSTYHTETYYWWLRDSHSNKANEVNIVLPDSEDETLDVTSVGLSSNGVRPAICVDISKLQ